MRLSAAAEDYLKAMYKLHTHKERATTNAIARQLGVRAASATNMVKQLAKLKLVSHSPYHGAELTSQGEKVALEIIRHHRLIELYLSEVVGMTWDKVDAEADRLEHVISDEFEDRIDAALGQPVADCHGDPIPTREGIVPLAEYLPLADVAPGTDVVVRRVSDSDPAVLRYLADLGLVPNAGVSILAVAPFHGPLTIRVGTTEHAIGRELAETVRVSAA
jgi:DtxR family transcriptional regulator, Mn-dependent transcriptional regulator